MRLVLGAHARPVTSASCSASVAVFSHGPSTVAGFLKMTRDGSAKTQYKPKTLNPSWPGKKIDLSTLSDKIKGDATLYISVYDYDFLQHDEILGTIQLNIQQLIKMQHGELSKILEFDRHLERYGKYGGKIQFTLEITPLVG